MGKTLHDNPVHFRQQRAGMKTSRYKSQLSFYLRSFCFPFVFGYVNLYANEGETKEKSKLPEIK